MMSQMSLGNEDREQASKAPSAAVSIMKICSILEIRIIYYRGICLESSIALSISLSMILSGLFPPPFSLLPNKKFD